MADRKAPDSKLAEHCLPGPLYRAIRHVYARGNPAMLVGGTAIAGYYAGHRRSDAMDLFTPSETAQKGTILAVKSLAQLGAEKLREETHGFMYDSTWQMDGHQFTAQVVLDENIHRVGQSIQAGDGVVVADLSTLLKMKAATLVSRCGEKDLFDLIWLFGEFEEYSLDGLVTLALEVDGGANAESMYGCVAGTKLSQAACDFGLKANAEEIFHQVESFRKDLTEALREIAKRRPAPELGKLVSALKPRKK